ncbi:ankyrin repeat domain-containing protein [Saccharothrix syringae]|uniref:ankyrin repeat domain-containing protein n=1 Tax=Saccharothrix syringae TaxID=103733 RepID=UPI001D174FC3|nr:ankyrin repeat domain-containing protein [Saccharothrix syringae]
MRHGRVDGITGDVDVLEDGRSALWLAVYLDRRDCVEALLAAGADPWRPMMSGWSPGRLAAAGPHADLFPGGPGLTGAEAAAVAEAPRLRAALQDDDYVDEGGSLACVSGIDVAEAVRRLGATTLEGDHEDDEEVDVVGATDVPGGCVLHQPWGYAAQMPGVTRPLSAGTTCYGVYANPKSGNQGSITRDGEVVGSDLHPGGEPLEREPADLVLLSYLYRHDATAYACAYAGLRPTDARAVTGPPDAWLRLPRTDHRT